MEVYTGSITPAMGQLVKHSPFILTKGYKMFLKKKKYDREKAQTELRKTIEHYERLVKQMQGYVNSFKKLEKQIAKMKEYEPVK